MKESRLRRLYVGSYTSDFGAFTGRGQGIALYQIDADAGALQKVSEIAAENPSYLALHPSGQFLFAVNEQAHVSAAPDNTISAFAVDPAGGLTLLNQQPALGGAPCFISVTPDGGYALTSNYGGGNCVMYPIGADGRLSAANDQVTHPSLESGRVPHAHSISIAPGGSYAVCCDLGLDQIIVYAIDLVHGKLRQRTTLDLARGSGPRHLAFHPNTQTAYVISEIAAMLTVCAWDGVAGVLKEIQTISTVPAGYPGQVWCADVHVHPNGRFIYGSNRVHDSLVIYEVDQADGCVTLLGHESTRGKTPRSFALSPDGDLLLVGNQDSDMVAVFRVDEVTGRLRHLATHDVPTPVCLKFA